MRKLPALILCVTVLLSLFVLPSAAEEKTVSTLIPADDRIFDSLFHIMPVSATCNSSTVYPDTTDPMRIFDNNPQSDWYENQVDCNDEYVPGTTFTISFDKVYPIEGVRFTSPVGLMPRNPHSLGARLDFYRDNTLVETAVLNRCEDVAHLQQYFTLQNEILADRIDITPTDISVTNGASWSKMWFFMCDLAFFTSDASVPLSTEYYTDAYVAFGNSTSIDYITGESVPNYIYPDSVTASEQTKDSSLDGVFRENLETEPDTIYSVLLRELIEGTWKATLPEQAKSGKYASVGFSDLPSFNVKYSEPRTIAGFDIIPGFAHWGSGISMYERTAKPNAFRITFKLGGNTVDSVNIYTAGKRSNCASSSSYSYQLSQFFKLNREVVADELDIQILSLVTLEHDDGIGNNPQYLALSRFGVIGGSGDTKQPTEPSTEAPTQAPTSSQTDPEDNSGTGYGAEVWIGIAVIVIIVAAAVIIIMNMLRKKH